jgi:hypothetical protein
MTGFWKNETGAVAVYIALTAPILIGFAALAVEVGSWILIKRDLQQVADTVAYSTAIRRSSENAEPVLVEFGIERASVMGLTARELKSGETKLPGHRDITVVPYDPNGNVEVVITRVLPRHLTQIYSGATPVEIRVRAVAGLDALSGDPACVVVLSTTADGAFTMQGSSVLDMGKCSTGSNSGKDDSFLVNGNKTDLIAKCVYTSGVYRYNGTLDLSGVGCEGDVVVNEPIVRDPFENLYLPVTSDFRNLPLENFKNPQNVSDLSKAMTGRINVQTRANEPGPMVQVPARRFSDLTLDKSVSLAPGLYIVDGGTLTIDGSKNNSQVISGSGVSFYLANGADLQVLGNAKLDISGVGRADHYNGLVFFSDGTEVKKGRVPYRFSGDSVSEIEGTMYFPNNELLITGNSQIIPRDKRSEEECLWIITNELSLEGDANVKLEVCDPAPPWAPNVRFNKRVQLIE